MRENGLHEHHRIMPGRPGFNAGEIEIVVQQNRLGIPGNPAEERVKRACLHRGIARCAFERFQLAG